MFLLLRLNSISEANEEIGNLSPRAFKNHKEGLSERQKEKEVAEVIKEKESGSEKKNEVSEDQKEDVKEVKEKKKRTRVAKKTEE